jgi:hypothetical protein
MSEIRKLRNEVILRAIRFVSVERKFGVQAGEVYEIAAARVRLRDSIDELQWEHARIVSRQSESEDGEDGE